MGEQESSSSNSSPVFIVIMRNSRGKLFVYVAILGVLCFIVFLLSSTHTSLKELESVNEKCQQQRDSLSAQLQVVFEHKNRLENSLQKEKTNHKHTKEENEGQLHELKSKIQEEKDREKNLDAQILQLKTRYKQLEAEKRQSESALTEQLKTVTTQKDMEIGKLQNHITELLSEKDKLESINAAEVWKLEQHANELTYCKLQYNQTKNELIKCQEQMTLKLTRNMASNNLLTQITTNKKKMESDKVVLKKSEIPPNEIKTENKVDELKDHANNNSTHQPSTEKKVLPKPHILPPNNAVDGVLPKPEEERNEDIDAAVEVPEMKKGYPDGKLLHVNDKQAEVKMNFIQDEKRENGNVFRNYIHKEQENHPQVLPPNNFDAGEKDDHAAERGEYGVPYGVLDAKQQVEVPVYNAKHNVKRKNFMPIPQQGNNIDIAAQMQDMMNKSPGDVNNFEDQNALHIPFQGFGAIDKKIRQFKHDGDLLHKGIEGNNGMDDKNYEEDDDDRENDDDQGNGIVPEMKGIHVLQDNDFDDQDNQENGDNAKEEGVVVAPK